jgi:CBS domain-containing protein
MNLRDVMCTPPIFVYLETPLWRAARAMSHNNCGFLPVVHNGVPQGVVTAGDLARATALECLCPYATTVSQIMSAPAVSLSVDSKVEEAVELMRDKRVRRIAVVDGGGILRGVVSLSRLTGHVSDERIASTLRFFDESAIAGRALVC